MQQRINYFNSLGCFANCALTCATLWGLQTNYPDYDLLIGSRLRSNFVVDENDPTNSWEELLPQFSKSKEVQEAMEYVFASLGDLRASAYYIHMLFCVFQIWFAMRSPTETSANRKDKYSGAVNWILSMWERAFLQTELGLEFVTRPGIEHKDSLWTLIKSFGLLFTAFGSNVSKTRTIRVAQAELMHLLVPTVMLSWQSLLLCDGLG